MFKKTVYEKLNITENGVLPVTTFFSKVLFQLKDLL